MENYKCPICGSKEAVDAAVLSTNDSIGIRMFGNNSYGYQNYCNLEPRGLINWGTESLDGRIVFSPRLSTKVCTRCGFVSFHALTLATAIAKDLVILQEKDSELLDEEKRLIEEKSGLNAEWDAIPAQQGQFEDLIKSEDITIRQQKEYQSELGRIEERKLEIGKRIKAINSRMEVITYNRDLLNRAKEQVHDHPIDKILSCMK